MQLLDLLGVLLWREGSRREGKEGREGREGREAEGERGEKSGRRDIMCGLS